MKLCYVGVDLAKNVFQLHGVDRHGQAVWRRRLRRGQWLKVLLETVESGCIIGMEACASAHHWARQLKAHGYDVRLVASQFVKPFVKSNKNDRNDAEAICEAITHPHMRFVPVKTVWQQDLQEFIGFAALSCHSVTPRPTRSVVWWPNTGLWRRSRCTRYAARYRNGSKMLRID